MWDVTFVMDKGRILGTYTREALGDEDLEELFFSVTGQSGKNREGEMPVVGQKGV